ncbi:MAG: UDP-glucose dehydrogenase family protein [Gammaproteobacteria bacterium]
MQITVIGAGYVGLVTAACLAELGNRVTCMEIDKKKVARLNNGEIPIYEPGLEELVHRNMREGRLSFVTDLNEQDGPSEVYYIAVGTPSSEDGSPDLQYVISAVRMVGQYIENDCVIVDKSTVPVGVADKVKAAVQEELDQRGVSIDFDVVSNPEFLREGAAIDDFMKPDRLVIGYSSERAREVLASLYAPIIRNHGGEIFYMPVKDAEMTKYAVNAMLAARISFMNEMAMICERFGVDIDNVRKGVGSDSRIGERFLFPGCGYGGSCFPKDVKALVSMAKGQAFDPIILTAVEQRNALQKQVLHEKVIALFGEDLSDVTIALWGLAFKPGTDDMREASSVVFLNEVMSRGAKVQAYDPAAMEVASRMLPEAWQSSGRLTFAAQQNDVLKNADCLVVATEWKSFLNPDLSLLKRSLANPVILDGRNIYDPEQMKREGFAYSGIGRGLNLEALSALQRSSVDV